MGEPASVQAYAHPHKLHGGILNTYLPSPVDLEDQEETFLPCYHSSPGTPRSFSHNPSSLADTFPRRCLPESTPRPSAADTRALLTSVAVHIRRPAGADRVAPADALKQPAVGDTLVRLADAL